MGRIMTKMGFPSSYQGGRLGYKAMVRDYDEAVRYQKELAMAKEGEEEESKKADEVKDMQEAPEQVQDMYDRLLGETDDETF